MKLRLLLLDECNRRCVGCCNKNFNTSALPLVGGSALAKYSMYILTGGEPMLYPQLVRQATSDIRAVSNAPIVLYTASTRNVEDLCDILSTINGLTVTLHTRGDVEPFKYLAAAITRRGLITKSLRLNVFAPIVVPDIDVSAWNVKANIEWIKDCPLPNDEVFMRYQQEEICLSQ